MFTVERGKLTKRAAVVLNVGQSNRATKREPVLCLRAYFRCFLFFPVYRASFGLFACYLFCNLHNFCITCTDKNFYRGSFLHGSKIGFILHGLHSASIKLLLHQESPSVHSTTKMERKALAVVAACFGSFTDHTSPTWSPKQLVSTSGSLAASSFRMQVIFGSFNLMTLALQLASTAS